jgi:hypothetical protein
MDWVGLIMYEGTLYSKQEACWEDLSVMLKSSCNEPSENGVGVIGL